MPNAVELVAKLEAMTPSDDPKTAALDELRAMRILREKLESEPAMIVDARNAGASWEEIVAATGYSRATVNVKAKSANGGKLPDVGWQWRNR